MTAGEGLGVDIGGVLIDRVREEGSSDVGADYGAASPVDGAFEAVAQLVARRFGERVWLVSRCDEAVEGLILDWLNRWRFFATTGVAPDRVHFCRERHEKAAICRRLALTHFVDDRLEVLSHLVGVVPHLYHLQSRAVDPERFSQARLHVRRSGRWADIARALLS